MNLKKWVISISIVVSIAASKQLYGQYRVVTDEEWTIITKALTIGKTAIQDIEDLEKQIKLYEISLNESQQARNIERLAHIATKNMLLHRMRALAQFRIRKRPLLLKIVGLGIFIKDKHDKELEEQIKGLEKELEANGK